MQKLYSIYIVQYTHIYAVYIHTYYIYIVYLHSIYTYILYTDGPSRGQHSLSGGVELAGLSYGFNSCGISLLGPMMLKRTGKTNPHEHRMPSPQP